MSPVPPEPPTQTPAEPSAPSLRAEWLAIAAERERLRRGRRWAFLLIGLAISVPVHVAIAIWLMNIYWVRPGPVAGEEITFEFAVMSEPSLEERPPAEIPEANAPAVDRSDDAITAVALAAVEPADHLPLEAPQHRLDVPPVRHAPAHQLPLRILVAEDHPVNQRLVCAFLAPGRHEVVVVDDGAAAIAALDAGAFDVVLMDVQMPGMDGVEATAAIRARATPIARCRSSRSPRTP